MFRIKSAVTHKDSFFKEVPLNGNFPVLTLEQVLRKYQAFTDCTSCNPVLKDKLSRTTRGRSLYLAKPPILTKDGESTVLSVDPVGVVMHEGFLSAPNVHVTPFPTATGSLWSYEFILPGEIGDKPHRYSQAYMFDRDSNGNVERWSWLFGRSNGLSNLADELLNGVRTSPEHLFQGFKVLFVFSLRMKAVEETLMSEVEKEAAMLVLWEQLLQKLDEVHKAGNGFKAKQAVGFKTFSMSGEEVNEWGRYSTTILLFCMMFRLADPVSFGVLQEVAALKKQLPDVPFFVGEIAGAGEEQYSTAKTGTEFKDLLVQGKYQELFDENGLEQKCVKGIDEAWEKGLSPHNIAGKIATFLVLTVEQTPGITHEDWASILNPYLLFPVIGTPLCEIQGALAARDRAIDKILAVVEVSKDEEILPDSFCSRVLSY